MAHSRWRRLMAGSEMAGAILVVILSLVQALVLAATPAGAAGGSWPVYHHDAARTGVAGTGPSLTTPTQRWATPPLDGAIFGEPVVSGSVVIVVTENDTVYGLDAGSGSVVWSNHLATPATLSFVHQVGQSFGVNCGDIDPLGITSTPVIDEIRGEVFVAAEVNTGTDVAHQLFGLNIATGQLMLQATSVDPPGLHPVAEQQRAALALGNGRVYVSFGGLAGDCGQYIGAVDSVTEEGGAPVSWIVPTTREGGIWGPSGPAIAPNGDVFVSVGNGAQTDPNQTFDGSDSVTQLSPTLTFKSVFAPTTWASENASDLDLGSSGPELLQNGTVFQIGKTGVGYLLDASNLGGVGGQLGSTSLGCASFGGQAYAAPTIYLSCTDGVRAVQVNAQNNGFDVLWQGPSAADHPPILGGGLVWIVGSDQSMYGLDPSSGKTVANLPLPASEHFVTPTVADGELLVGTGTTVEAYDQGPPAPPGAPTIGEATAGNAEATVAFTPPSNDGGLPITSYAATAHDLTNPSKGGQTASGPASPVTVAGLTNGDSYDFTVSATNAKGTGPPSAASNVVVPSAEPYHSLAPSRITDTRPHSGSANAGRTLGPGATLDVQVTGAGGVPPSGVGAAVLNVTATNPTKQSYLTVWPTGAPRPTASNLNFAPGQTVPNLAEVGLGTGGKVSVFNPAGSVDVVVDVEGYTAAAGAGTGLYNPLTPARITDTRPSSGLPNAGKTLGPGAQLDVQVTGAGAVPASGVDAVVLNVTATNPTEQSYLTVWPKGATRPTASNLNFAPGQTVPNRVIVHLGSGGQVSIFNPSGSVDVVVDAGGYFTDGSNAQATGAQFTPTAPVRITDTRPGSGFPNAGDTLGAGRVLTVPVAGVGGAPASGVTAAVLNVTVTNTTESSFLTVWPTTVTQPRTSDLNWVAGETVPNLVVGTLKSDGAVQAFNAAGSTDVVVDVSGWYS
jgi:hypothetical protein